MRETSFGSRLTATAVRLARSTARTFFGWAGAGAAGFAGARVGFARLRTGREAVWKRPSCVAIVRLRGGEEMKSPALAEPGGEVRDGGSVEQPPEPCARDREPDQEHDRG